MPRKYQVALSFAGEDRPYVERVANALVSAGVTVFYDGYEEATLWGRNLYDHLQRVYGEEAEFTVMFISEAYARKLWTNHERQSAQARAFEERHEYILPARLDDTPVPGLQKTIGYVDLRQKTPDELAALIVQKVKQGATAAVATRLATLREHPLSAAALDEFDAFKTVSVAIANSILAEETPLPQLAELLLMLVTGSSGDARVGLGKLAMRCVDRFNVGYEAVEFCLAPGVLDEWMRDQLAMKAKDVMRPDAIRWAHGLLTKRLRKDMHYCSFLDTHLSFVLTHLANEMTAYLLVPDRGPAHDNVASFFLVARSSSKPQPFVRRLSEWLYAGRFDGPLGPGVEEGNEERDDAARRDQASYAIEASVLYEYLNKLCDMPGDHPLQSLRSDVVARTRNHLESFNNLRKGLYHLYYMRTEQFIDLDAVVSRINGLHDGTVEERRLYRQLRTGIGFDAQGESRQLAAQLGILE